MTKKPPGRVPVEAAATDAEVQAAVQGLSVADLLKLERHARWLVWPIRPSKLKARVWNDLLDDAIIATLDGRRVWRRTIPFVQHLRGAMRSIASNWKSDVDSDPAVPASQMITEGADGDFTDPLESASEATGQDDALNSKELVLRLREYFEDDALVVVVMDALAEGYGASELPGFLDVSPNKCAAALKRLRRYAYQRFSDRR